MEDNREMKETISGYLDELLTVEIPAPGTVLREQNKWRMEAGLRI